MAIDLSGVVIIDKEEGMTSHDVVSRVRGRFKIKKVGHAGTLDPSATGVLVLLLGKATKLSEKFSSQEKEYRAVMKLGERTDSGDREGKLISSREVACSLEEVKIAMDKFTGEIEQVPPMVSAKKVNGKRLYKMARKGIEVERAPQKIFIKEMEVLGIEMPFVAFRTVCSKGTYIRQIADDIGEELGCGAYITELCRTRSGSFSIEDATPLPKILNMDPETFNESIIRI